jgi:hypothetical protein
MNTSARQYIERKIASAVVTAALKAGYSVSVNNGEDLPVKKSTDKALILKNMFQTDDEHLFVYNGDKFLGWIHFVYGNEGWDVVSDYIVSLESIANSAEVQKLIARFET